MSENIRRTTLPLPCSRSFLTIPGLAAAYHSVVCGFIVIVIDVAGGAYRAKINYDVRDGQLFIMTGYQYRDVREQALVSRFASSWYQVLDTNH